MKNNIDKTGRRLKKFSTEGWIELVAEYRKSDLTLRQFAAVNELNPNTFKYWIYDVKNLKKKAGRKTKNKHQNFIEITSSMKESNIGVEVIMPNGIRVNLNSVSKDDVSFLIKEVSRCLD